MLTSVWSRDQASFVNYLFSRMSYDAMRPRTLPSLAGNAGYWEHRTQSCRRAASSLKLNNRKRGAAHAEFLKKAEAMTNDDDDAATVVSRSACLADLPVPVLAHILSTVGVRNGLRAAAAAECLRDGLVTLVRADMPEARRLSWRTAVRAGVAHECAFAFDALGDGMTRRAGGEWLRCWRGELRVGRERSRFAFYRVAADWVHGNDGNLQIVFPPELNLGLQIESAPELSLVHEQHYSPGIWSVDDCLPPGPCVPFLVLNEPTEEERGVAGHANFFGPAQRWRALSHLLDHLINEARWASLEGRACFELGRASCMTYWPQLFLAPWNHVKARLGLRLPDSASSILMGGHGTTQSVVGVAYPARVVHISGRSPDW